MAEPARGRSANLVAVLVLLVLAVALVVWQRPWQSSDDDSAVEIPADAAAQLSTQFRQLSSASTRAEFVAAAGDTRRARTFADEAWSARETLGARGVELRYVGGGDVADRVDGSAVATVEVSWTPGDASGLTTSADHSSSVSFRVAPQRDGTFAIVGVTPKDGALPIWLAGKVTLDHAPDVTVIRVDGGDDALPVESMSTTASTAVRRVVPGSDDDLTIVSAHTQAQMAQLVGRDVADVAQIAAVTTRLDGRSGTATGTVILLNPAVFATMDRRAAQVVMTHEATHLLTGAAGTSAESWVVEGFADFVALHDDTAPLAVSAGQILAQVKAGGAPDHLPTSTDFGTTSHGLGAVYESAWMIFRLLGDRYGDDKVVAFYDAVLRGTSVPSALKSSFDLTEARLTADWRAYLTKSASTVS